MDQRFVIFFFQKKRGDEDFFSEKKGGEHFFSTKKGYLVNYDRSFSLQPEILAKNIFVPLIHFFRYLFPGGPPHRLFAQNQKNGPGRRPGLFSTLI